MNVSLIYFINMKGQTEFLLVITQTIKPYISSKMKFFLLILSFLLFDNIYAYSKYEYDMSSSNCVSKTFNPLDQSNLAITERETYKSKCLSSNSSGSWYDNHIILYSGFINNSINFNSFSIEIWYYYKNLWNPEIFGIYDTETNTTVLSIHSDYVKIDQNGEIEIYDLPNIWSLDQMIVTISNNTMEIYLSNSMEYQTEMLNLFSFSEKSYFMLSFYEGLYIYNLNVYNQSLTSSDVDFIYKKGGAVSLPILYDQIYTIEENSNITINFNYSWSDEDNDLPNLNYCLFKV